MFDHNSENAQYVWPRPGMGAGEILGMPHHVMMDGKLFAEKGIVNFLNGANHILVQNSSCIYVSNASRFVRSSVWVLNTT